jgi:hypothetical protein
MGADRWTVWCSPQGAPTRRVSGDKLSDGDGDLVRAVASVLAGDVAAPLASEVLSRLDDRTRWRCWLGWRTQSDRVGLRPTTFHVTGAGVDVEGPAVVVGQLVGLCAVCWWSDTLCRALSDGVLGRGGHVGSLTAARVALGGGRLDDAASIRRAFRTAVLSSHPDVVDSPLWSIDELIAARDALLSECGRGDR